MDGKSLFALTRAGAAIIATAILLACTGWAFLNFLGSPAQVTQGAELADGAYVTADVGYIMDICGLEREVRTGKVAAYYAIVPVGDQFVVVRFPAAAYDTIAEMEAETWDYLYGRQSTLQFHLDVTGMVKGLGEEQAALLSQWFSENTQWMIRAGMIAEVEDYGTYLCGYMIDTGSTGAVSTPAAGAMTLAALALLIYAAAECVLIARGHYRRKGGAHG